MKSSKPFSTGISLFITLALCGTAAAEIEEITITAQKREENVQDVPISVSTFSDDFFTKSNVHTLRDMARYTPNLSMPQSSAVANQRIILRGVGSVGNSAIEPSVAVFIDGVYYPRPSSIVGSMTDLERVEVLRGPQGTLFGRNASMGALNIVTKNPTDEDEGRVTVGYGDYDEKRVSGYINGAISERASARLSFQVSDRDGYGDNTYTDRDSRSTVGDWEDVTVRGKLLLTPSANTDILLTADYSRLRNGGAVTELIGETVPENSVDRLAYLLPTGELPDTESPYDYKVNQVNRDDVDDDQWGLSGDVTWMAGDHTIRSITAYRDWQNDSWNQSVIRMPADLVPSDQYFDTETFSQELQITSPEGEDFEYVLGLYYYDEKYTLDTVARLGEDFCGLIQNIVGGRLSGNDFAGARNVIYSSGYRSGIKELVDGTVAGVLNFELPSSDEKTKIENLLIAGGTQISSQPPEAAVEVSEVLKQSLTTELETALADFGPTAVATADVIANTLVSNSAAVRGQAREYAYSLDPQNPQHWATLQKPGMAAGVEANEDCEEGGTPLAVAEFSQDVEDYAAYAHLTYHLTSQWRLAAGTRYTRSEKEGSFVSTVPNKLARRATLDNPYGLDLRQEEDHPDLKLDEEKVTWLANLSYFLDDDTMLFANFSTGFKSGGFNPEGFNSKVAEAGRTRKFDTETTKNYELGIKRTMLEGRLITNATLYRTKINDFQERQYDGLNLTVHNSGDLTQQGVELDVMFQPREEFFATLGVSYLDSEFDAFPNATGLSGHLEAVSQANLAVASCFADVASGLRVMSECMNALPAHFRSHLTTCLTEVASGMRSSVFECSNPVPIPTRDLKGERNHFSPKWQVALSAEWTDSLPDIAADWFIRGEYQYVDDQNVGADTNQNPDTMQSGYNLFNGGAGVRSQTGDWEVSVFVKNIFDEEYCQVKYVQPLVGSLGLTDVESGGGAILCTVGDPQTWGLVGSFFF